jgi:DNA-directed RNA polymerase specialized sigma24 family protein
MPATSTRHAYQEPLLLLERVRPKVRSLFRRLAVPDDEGEGLIQDTLLALVYKWHQIADHEYWLLKTLESRCLRLYGVSRQAAS